MEERQRLWGNEKVRLKREYESIKVTSLRAKDSLNVWLLVRGGKKLKISTRAIYIQKVGFREQPLSL